MISRGKHEFQRMVTFQRLSAARVLFLLDLDLLQRTPWRQGAGL